MRTPFRHALVIASCAAAMHLAFPALATAAERVALVIGNNDYRHMSRLDNPARDAAAVAKVFRDAGFKVIEKIDIDRAEFLDAIDELRAEAKGADVAVVFYAGHGGEVAGRDVLAPKDLRYSCQTKSLERAVRVTDVVEAIAGAKKKILVLDACRNEPFPQCPTRGADGGGGFRSLGRLDGAGMIIANSTSPGSVAADGPPGSNSPFAAALVERLKRSPREMLMRVLLQVSKDVHEQTNGEQTPEISLRGAEPEACLVTEGCGQAPTNRAPQEVISRVQASTVTVYSYAAPQPKVGTGAADNAKLPPDFQKFFKDSPGQPPKKADSVGTGFLVSDKGHILTTGAMTNGADRWEIELPGSRQRYAVDFVGQDTKLSIVALKIREPMQLPSPLKLASRPPLLGEPVFLVSSIRGLAGTVTLGAISNLPGHNTFDFVQLDAVTQLGATGSPVADTSGQVIGVVGAILTDSPAVKSGGVNSSNVTLAVPAASILRVLSQIIEKGRVDRGWFGVSMKDVDDDLAARIGLRARHGVLLVTVTADTPAYAAGFRAGDVVLDVNGRTVDNSMEFALRIADHMPGAVIAIRRFRAGAEEVVQVKLGVVPSAPSPTQPAPTDIVIVKALGMTLAPESRTISGVTTVGLRVMAVEAGGPAALKMITQSDLLVEMNGQAVRTLADVEARLAEVNRLGRKAVLVRLAGNGGERFVALVPNVAPAAAPQ